MTEKRRLRVVCGARIGPGRGSDSLARPRSDTTRRIQHYCCCCSVPFGARFFGAHLRRQRFALEAPVQGSEFSRLLDSVATTSCFGVPLLLLLLLIFFCYRKRKEFLLFSGALWQNRLVLWLVTGNLMTASFLWLSCLFASKFLHGIDSWFLFLELTPLVWFKNLCICCCCLRWAYFCASNVEFPTTDQPTPNTTFSLSGRCPLSSFLFSSIFCVLLVTKFW